MTNILNIEIVVVRKDEAIYEQEGEKYEAEGSM